MPGTSKKAKLGGISECRVEITKEQTATLVTYTREKQRQRQARGAKRNCENGPITQGSCFVLMLLRIPAPTLSCGSREARRSVCLDMRKDKLPLPYPTPPPCAEGSRGLPALSSGSSARVTLL